MRSRATLNHRPFRTPLFAYTPRKQGVRLEARLSSQPCVHVSLRLPPPPGHAEATRRPCCGHAVAMLWPLVTGCWLTAAVCWLSLPLLLPLLLPPLPLPALLLLPASYCHYQCRRHCHRLRRCHCRFLVEEAATAAYDACYLYDFP